MKYDLAKFNVGKKVRLLAGVDIWHTDDLGGKVYKVKVSDGPVGLHTHELTGDFKTVPATAFPSIIVLSQTRNLSLAYRTGEIFADECVERDVDMLLSIGLAKGILGVLFYCF